jgi:hypothetical protein
MASTLATLLEQSVCVKKIAAAEKVYYPFGIEV